MVLTGIGESQNGKKAKMVFTLDKDPVILSKKIISINFY